MSLNKLLTYIKKNPQPFILGSMVLALIIFVGKNLSPFIPGLFEYHDPTQGARVMEFAVNLTNGIIPPRIAPDMSYGMGYALYNFYAPFAYWITTIIHLLGIPVIATLKLSFLLSIVFSFVFIFLLLRHYFSFFPALVGAALYASSPYFAVEIFIRGNLAETWYLALLPLALYLLTISSKKTYVLTVIVLSFLFTVHNVFSLLSIFVLSAYILLLKNKKMNFLLLGMGLLLSSYFLIPAVLESKLTYASQIAQATKYEMHFLCPWQIWSSPWGYGGSTSGCIDDGMSFQLGKLQILFAVFGLGMLFYRLVIKKDKLKENLVIVAISIFTIVMLFLTTYESSIVWQIVKPMALFQFPWRFLVFGMFGLAFIAAYGFSKLKIPFKPVLLVLLTLGIILFNRKFFGKVLVDNNTYTSMYLSKGYIHTKTAYEVPEYFPRSGSYEYWQSLRGKSNPELTRVDRPMPLIFGKLPAVLEEENKPFSKSYVVINDQPVTLNINYFPSWKIYVDGKHYEPKKFDKLGRPILQGPFDKTRVQVKYSETPIQRTGSLITLFTFLFLLFTLYKPQIWNKLQMKNS